jgi:DNA-directed RNA polymerase III subunit RPC2
MRYLLDLGMKEIVTDSSYEGYVVFLNGVIIGFHSEPEELARSIRAIRRRRSEGSHVSEFLSVFVNDSHRAIYIADDNGRLCRPLIVADVGQMRLTAEHMAGLGSEISLQQLLDSGVIEYIDANEENNCLIAIDERELTDKHTHVEIDPLSILGILAGLVPYPHHNQSPRNTYQCAMGKQAIGTLAHNQYERMDTITYTLVYPQKPMVKTRTMDLVNFDHLPGGQNASVAVMSYSVSL